MYVIGGHGYVGSRVVADAVGQRLDVEVVTRTGVPGLGRSSVAWPDLEALIQRQSHPSVVWLLDGAKHAETDRLAELLSWAPRGTHVVAVSTCTVYGDQRGALCTERTPLQLVTPHARIKASSRTTGVFNVASANMTFADAAGTAAGLFDASVESDGKPDPSNYQVDSTAARQCDLLDEHPAEDLPSCTRAFAGARTPADPQP